MQSRPSRYLRSLLIFVRLGLLLLVGLGVVVAGGSLPAHAAPEATLTVTDCSGQTGPGRIGTVISSASALDTITFSCSGTIPISSTLTISTTLTLDGSGQSVTLDGGTSTRVLFVNSGVTFTLNALTVAHGGGPTVDGGGGLANNGGSTVNISNSTFANNSTGILVSGNGGGVGNGGTMNISNSTFSGNVGFDGGGLFNTGTVSISNSTFSGNVADNSGSALLNDGGTVSISNSTVANNGARTLVNFSGTLKIGGSIVANNQEVCGNASSLGYNLESGTNCGFTSTGDLQNTDPKLASALASNGGATQTIALLSTSPAIDHIPATSCPATDQRGVSRLAGERCDIGAFEFPDTTAPTLSLPGTITVNANSSGMAVVTYTATATDDDGDPLAATCKPASGSAFSIGTTTVNCSASEPGSNTASGSFLVVVEDVTPPVLSLPANIAVDATSPQGAVVTYTATSTDDDGTHPAVTCMPASGSTFAIGTTTVNCSATDAAGNSASGSFQVVVKGAAAQVNDLISLVNSFGLPADFQASFDTQLQAVLADLQANNTTQACSDLTAFSNHVQAQSGKGLTSSQANQLLAAAKQIRAVLGC